MISDSSTNQQAPTTDMRKSPLQSPTVKFGCRDIQLLFYCLAFLCYCGIEVVPSVTLLAMTKPDAAHPNAEIYDWSENINNIILSSFLWGYTVTLIPGSQIAQCLGAKQLMCVSFGMCGIITALIPIVARYGGWQVVATSRVLIGALLGFTPSCMFGLISKWIPPVERGRAGSRVYVCGLIGLAIAFSSNGAISNSSLGWPSCYYIWGGVTVLWAAVFHFIGKQSPAVHPTISLAEKEYIENSLGVSNTDMVQKLKTPWMAILTSKPVWALLITQCANNWGTWILLAKIPTYMTHVLGYNIFVNGVMTALPHLVACALSFPISYACDKMVKDGVFSLTTTRKIANSIGLFIPAIALIGFSFFTSEYRIFAVVILILTVGFNVAICCGFLMNPVDLSPNFSGALGGIVHTAASIMGLLAPLICGVIVSDITNIYEWRTIFFMTAGFYIIGNMMFIFYGDAEVQSWNKSFSTVENNTSMTIDRPITQKYSGDVEENS